MDDLIRELNNPDEKIRSATAFALGGVVAGSVQKYFPALLEYLQETTVPLERSLILHSIKEVQPFFVVLMSGDYLQLRGVKGAVVESI
jgi:HEAT repeat protein